MWLISACIFTVAFLDYLWLLHSLNAFHNRTSNAHNFLICERKHQVWVCIFLVRTFQIFWHQNYFGFTKKIRFCISAPPFSVDERLHIAYNKYKIKRKFTYFGKYQIYLSLEFKASEFSLRTRDKSDVFNYIWYSPQKSKYLAEAYKFVTILNLLDMTLKSSLCQHFSSHAGTFPWFPRFAETLWQNFLDPRMHWSNTI